MYREHVVIDSCEQEWCTSRAFKEKQHTHEGGQEWNSVINQGFVHHDD